MRRTALGKAFVGAAIPFALFAAWLPAGAATTAAFSIAVAGPQEDVFDWSRDRCDREDFPDLAARAFRDASGRVQLIAPTLVNRRMIGRDIDSIARDCRIVMESGENERPDAFDDREWIAATYTEDGRTVYALVHDEYQGWRRPSECPSRQPVKCWYNALTLAVSRDGGRSYGQAVGRTHRVAPRRRTGALTRGGRPYRQAPGHTHLVAASANQYVPDVGPVGIFRPSNIMRNPRDGYLYAFVQQVVRDGTRNVATACLIRTRNIADARSWRAWDGSGFGMRFADPYREPGLAQPCTPVAYPAIADMGETLTYNTYLGVFVLLGATGAYDPAQKRVVYGIFYSLSKDLITWTGRRLVLEAELMSTWRCGDPDPIAYPSLLDPTSASRNFDTTGERAYLYFTVLHNDNARCQYTYDRDLVRVPIEFKK